MVKTKDDISHAKLYKHHVLSIEIATSDVLAEDT